MFRLLLTFTFFSLVFCESNSTIGSRHPRIIQGFPARRGQFQSMVSIRRWGVLSENLGGGSLITNNFILTAATVIGGLRTHQVAVAIGILDVGVAAAAQHGGFTMIAINLRRHPGFADGAIPVNNIALIQIWPILCRLNGVGAVFIESRLINPPFTAVAVGWGATTNAGELHTILRYRDVTQAPAADCGANFPAASFCMQPVLCGSDVGGPLIVGTGLIGIASFTNCSAANSVDHYARVSTYFGWISGITGIF